MVMTKPQHWQQWVTPLSVLVACMATSQTGQGFGGFGRWFMKSKDTASEPLDVI
jgi:hypothetical protein